MFESIDHHKDSGNKEETAKKERRIEGIRDHYNTFKEFVEIFEGKKDFLRERGADYDLFKDVVESDLSKLLDNSTKAIKEGPNVSMSNSFVDTFGNAAVSTLGYLINRAQKNELEGDDISERKKQTVEQNCSILDRRAEELKNYADILNSNEDILNDELTKQNGYLEDFTQYFKIKEGVENSASIRTMPTGPSRIKYVTFFNKLSNKKIENQRNLEEELELLTDKFVDKDKIRSAFL